MNGCMIGFIDGQIDELLVWTISRFIAEIIQWFSKEDINVIIGQQPSSKLL